MICADVHEHGHAGMLNNSARPSAAEQFPLATSRSQNSGANGNGFCSVAIPAEVEYMPCCLSACADMRMLGGTADDFTTSLLLAAAGVAAESDVHPSSASISAIDCSILASVKSAVTAGCTSARGDVASFICAAAGKAAD